MVYLLDAIALVLASDALVTAWFYGSIFEARREALEERDDLLGELAGCTLCLPYHICLGVAITLWASAQLLDYLPYPWAAFSVLPRVVLYGLAATDLVHWLQGDRPIPVEDENPDDDDDPPSIAIHDVDLSKFKPSEVRRDSGEERITGSGAA